MVIAVQIVALTNLKVVAGYIPWKMLRYKGCPSRYMYLCTSMIPLLCENIPRLINQMMFLLWSGGTDNQITVISTMGLALPVHESLEPGIRRRGRALRREERKEEGGGWLKGRAHRRCARRGGGE